MGEKIKAFSPIMVQEREALWYVVRCYRTTRALHKLRAWVMGSRMTIHSQVKSLEVVQSHEVSRRSCPPADTSLLLTSVKVSSCNVVQRFLHALARWRRINEFGPRHLAIRVHWNQSSVSMSMSMMRICRRKGQASRPGLTTAFREEPTAASARATSVPGAPSRMSKRAALHKGCVLHVEDEEGEASGCTTKSSATLS